mgnify:FL=1
MRRRRGAARGGAAHRGAGAVNIRRARARAAQGRTRRTCCHVGGGARCPIQPTFGVAGGVPLWCGAHRRAGTVDVVHKMCGAAGCRTQPSFGPPGGAPLWCAAHRSAGAVGVVGHYCLWPGCDLFASFGAPRERGVRARLWCAAHRRPGDVSAGCNRIRDRPRAGPADAGVRADSVSPAGVRADSVRPAGVRADSAADDAGGGNDTDPDWDPDTDPDWGAEPTRRKQTRRA